MVMSGSQRSKEDDVQKISTSVFVTNFPYGTKVGKRFGFVRFIKVLDIDRLINNLCTVWVGRNKIHANVARFQREPLHKQSNKVNNKGTNNVNHGAKGMTNSYAHLVKGNQVQNVGMEECPNMVLNKKRNGINIDDKHEDSLKYPPEFIHNEEGDVPVEKADNWSDENRVNDGQEDGVEVSNDIHESTCFGHFKKSKVPRKGGSILELIDDLVNVGHTMGYDIT
nr:nucleotide-binding alpha-beta plait domain-containing protein [Tanacetum cinerariifolium]